MNPTQDWIEAYKELCAAITDPAKGISEVKYVDLWYNQVDYLPEEYPFGAHAVFLEFNMDDVVSLGGKAQDLNAKITVYHVFDTLSDTYDKSANQPVAFEFGNVNRKLHKLLQGLSGANFSALNRESVKRYPAAAGYLVVYSQTYSSIIRDYSAIDEYTEETVTGFDLEQGAAPVPPDLGLFRVNM